MNQLSIDDSGDFNDEWPDGFFEERRGFILILKEFALDPNLIKDWDSCRLFLMPFDIYQGRQLSEFQI